MPAPLDCIPVMVRRPAAPSRSRESSEADYRAWMEVFGRRFREARISADMTQYDISLRMPGSGGQSQSYVSKIEKGQVNLTARSMAQLATIVGVPLRNLICPPHET